MPHGMLTVGETIILIMPYGMLTVGEITRETASTGVASSLGPRLARNVEHHQQPTRMSRNSLESL